jgi:hypothetical protein
MNSPNETLQVIGWILSNFHVLGWIALLGFLWRAFRFVSKLSDRAIAVEAHVTKMATNCFPTMQASLQNQDGLLRDMCASLKTQDGLLHSVDSSLKTLVERDQKKRKK